MAEKRAAILGLSAAGKTPTEISRNLNCSRTTVYSTIARGTSETAPRVRPRPARPDNLVDSVRNFIEAKRGKVTIRGLARDFDVDKRTMGRLVHEDIGQKTFKRTPRHGLKPVDRSKRLERAQKMLKKIKHKPAGTVILFSDETPFSLGEIVASDTGFYLAEVRSGRDDDVIHTSKERHFASLQILAVVASDGGKCPLVFLKDKERLTAATYIKYLREKVFPWARANYGDRWWWQQDGASCHTAGITQEFLAAETPGFWGKEDWPPHSPDLSPLDFAVFGRLKGMMSGVQYHNKDQLKAAIQSA